ncbi:branched-chain-amino-acid aminotransferase, cytosolic-like isoform X1 [Macrosteles quadrilineatus]|uniref:branched-chain-amino-acid aminotransferase, cytosolic-like isoform X1 n=1 Tax=Macrosteles quadrilineatus TaxID=74068 RepID=UPI0023E09F15|nr:branched-chain-amino-acid aminotransferase, cytosolic-like isoform X1 [Macrosteles quadrilineatus]
MVKGRVSLSRLLKKSLEGCCGKTNVNFLPPRRLSHLKPAIENPIQSSDISVRLCPPDRLQQKPEVSSLQFGKFFTDHMLKIEYHKSAGGWQQPCITPLEYLSLHPAAKVLHYAVELFEGMKAYRGVDGQIRIFRPELNMQRMNLSALRAGLPQFDSEQMIRCICRLINIDQEWVPHSEAASLYIRPTLIGTEPSLGVAMPESALLYTILCPVGSYFSGPSFKPVSLLADPRFVRAWPGGCGDRKVGSNYGPTIHIQKMAESQGYNQVLWLYGEEHQITEVGTMNIFILHLAENGEKVLVTPELNGLILPGITRQSILDLAREWGDVRVEERVITMSELVNWHNSQQLLEVFGAGTACVVCPVGLIQYQNNTIHLPTAEQKDPFFLRCLRTILDIQYGRIPHEWARPIDQY